MTEPTPNLPLLRAVLAQIDAHPERWNQTYWATKKTCGTAYCIAGWAVHISIPDATPIWGEDGTEDPFAASLMKASGGELISISDQAALLLGLTDIERYSLFFALNSRKSVQRVAEQIAARAGESL